MPLPLSHDGERVVLVRAAYRGSSTDAETMRQALLAPQMEVLSVDVGDRIFTMKCRTKNAAEKIMRLLPSLSMTLETFLVTAEPSPPTGSRPSSRSS